MVATAIELANDSGTPILALDAPSGLDATTGAAHTPTIRAEATLTLALPKLGLLTESAHAFVGNLYVADISVPPRIYVAMGVRTPNLFRNAEIIHLDYRQNYS